MRNLSLVFLAVGFAGAAYGGTIEDNLSAYNNETAKGYLGPLSESFGQSRVRTTLAAVHPDGASSTTDCWARLPTPEDVLDSSFVFLDDRPVLVVTTRVIVAFSSTAIVRVHSTTESICEQVKPVVSESTNVVLGSRSSVTVTAVV